MEKSDKKRILTRVLVVLAALTLLSCCFLGSTFARYVTNASGSASVGVAKWDIDVTNKTGNTALEVAFSSLSPSKVAHGSNGPRVHEHNGVLVAEIQNNGDVLADITVSLTDSKYYSSGSKVVSNWGDTAITSGGTAATEGEAKAVIKLQYAYNQTGSMPASSDWKEAGTSNTVKGVGIGGSVYVFIRAIWASYDTANATAADALDTWLGENVESVGATLNLTAVQASEAPSA